MPPGICPLVDKNDRPGGVRDSSDGPNLFRHELGVPEESSLRKAIAPAGNALLIPSSSFRLRDYTCGAAILIADTTRHLTGT